MRRTSSLSIANLQLCLCESIYDNVILVAIKIRSISLFVGLTASVLQCGMCRALPKNVAGKCLLTGITVM